MLNDPKKPKDSSKPEKEKLIARSTLAEKVHGKKAYFTYKGNQWRTVTSEIDWTKKRDNKRWISVGASKTRERLLLDENSPKMEELKQNVLKECQGKSPPEVLSKVNEIINSIGESNEDVVTKLIKEQRKKGKKHISIDFFIEKNCLVCRHRAILAAFLLGYLVKEGVLPEGNVRQYRSSFLREEKATGAHSWAVYREAKTHQLWLIDPQWKKTKNMSNQTDYRIASREYDPESIFSGYGKKVIDTMVNRVNKLDGVSEEDWDNAKIIEPKQKAVHVQTDRPLHQGQLLKVKEKMPLHAAQEAKEKKSLHEAPESKVPKKESHAPKADGEKLTHRAQVLKVLEPSQRKAEKEIKSRDPMHEKKRSKPPKSK